MAELPNDLGVEIAMIVRRIWLAHDWTDGGDSAALFTKDAEFVAERQSEAVTLMSVDTRPELNALIALLYGESGATLRSGEAAAGALEAVVEWAQRSGYVQTALNLAEAAAALAPTNPHAFFVAARTNRQIGDAWRAEVFYRAAILNAHRQQNWQDYIRAQLGLGTLFIDRGQLSSAALRYLRAARAAADQGIEWLAAQTFHDLASLHFQRGDLKAAVKCVMSALRLYPVMNERVPVAVHDLAFLHVVAHRYREAMELLELLIPLPLLPQDQVLVSGSVARAAGALGRQAQFAEAEARVLHFADAHKQHADAAFVNLAYGARALGLWARAAEHAARGARLASESEHAFVENVAWELLSQITAKAVPAETVPLPLVDEHAAAQLRALTETLRSHVGGWRWNPNQSGPRKLRPAQC